MEEMWKVADFEALHNALYTIFYLVFSVMSVEAVRAKADSETREPGIFLAFVWTFMPSISSKPFSSRDATGIRVGHTDSKKETRSFIQNPCIIPSSNIQVEKLICFPVEYQKNKWYKHYSDSIYVKHTKDKNTYSSVLLGGVFICIFRDTIKCIFLFLNSK